MTTTLPHHVGVVGGGRMGAGIAHAFLAHGCSVTVVEADDAAAAAAHDRILGHVQASVDRGRFDGTVAEAASRLTMDSDVGAFAGHELVIEAVPEVPAIKAEALRNVEATVDDEAWIATNTSSLSIDDLGEQLERPERFCGLHFFNPVPSSALVEVVIGARTSREVRDTASSWVRALGKTPIVVSDSPGFASSRLGVAIALEAIRMVEEGVASPEDIDNAMVLGYRFPIGPLALTDIVGLDVRLGIAEYLNSTLGPRFAPPQLMRNMVANGELGRKSGKGFYDYT